MKSIKKAFGYSLYELLITLGLVSVVLLLGMPTFGSLAADKKLRVEVDALFHAVHLARSESIVRRRVVSLCPSLNGQHCSGRDAAVSGEIAQIRYAQRQNDADDQQSDQQAVG